jgi:hypothetical protein
MEKVITVLIATLMIIPFIGFSNALAGEELVVTGTILSVNPDNGDVMIRDDAGNLHQLKADPSLDLKTLEKGQAVVANCNEDKIIQSITDRQ